MTADERIEALLNRFGETISDLPNGKDYDWSRPAYDDVHLQSAKKAAYVWMWDEYQDADIIPMDEIEPPLCDYICHLADVIDRMEVALETATRCADCDTCKHIDDKCQGDYSGCGDFPACNYCVDERHMHDVEAKHDDR